MSIESVYLLSLGILSISLIITSIEDIMHEEVFHPSGILSWEVAQFGIPWVIKGKFYNLANLIFRMENYRIFLYVQFANSILLFLSVFLKIISPILLLLEIFFLTLYIIRGPYGLDGAHQMSLIILLALFIGTLFGQDSNISYMCLWFVSLQLILSYAISGLRKGLSPIWRNGTGIQVIFSTGAYGNSFVFGLLRKYKFLPTFLSWSVIIFESIFFLVLFLNPPFVILFMSFGFLFHLANALFMGLNNFFFSFLATYPILYFCIQNLNQKILLP